MIKYYTIMKLNVLDNGGYVMETEDLIDFYIDKEHNKYLVDRTGIKKKINTKIIISEDTNTFCLRKRKC